MSKPSKAGAAFLIVFAIPFLGMGTALMLKFLSATDNTPNSIPGAIFAGGFALVGLLMIVGAIYGWQKLKQEAELKDQHPDAPWFWRQDWTQSRSDGQNRNRAVILWISTIVVSCLTLPWVSVGLNSPKRNSPPPLFFVVLASFSLILAISAIRATIRRQRFGKTYFQFDSLPISPGKKLTGRIEVHLAADAQHGIDLRLSCIRRITTGSGKEQSTHDEVLWEGQQNIASAMLASGPLGNSVPVAFDVPVDAYESNYDNQRDKVLWLLHAKADVPGIDFAEDYELPVFRTVPLAQPPSLTNSSTAFATQVGNASAAAPALQSESEPIETPAKTTAVISTDWSGTQFYFPPLRNPLQTLMLFGFTAAWTGAVYLLHRSNAPLFFAIVFGATDLLLIVAVLYSLFPSTRLELSNDNLLVRKSFLGILRVSSTPFSEVALIHPVASMQSGTKSWYSLRLTTKAGRKLNLVDGIADRQEARWLVSQLETLAGLKQDTRVEFNDFYGPPPQRGVTPAPNALPARRGSAWIAVVIFAAWLGFIVSRLVLPISRATHASTSVRPKT
ncbi:MAG TPA: hypothetical protein VM912_08760, partial [Terriglobales bacterium]|nr:hypothetical protein [Terriglobales bacterium]